MPIPLLAIFSCGVGVSPAPEFDEKDFCKRSNSQTYAQNKKSPKLGLRSW